MLDQLSRRPVIFGEVLFDCFPDAEVLGGAPFNVAWNLRGFGENPLMVTALGTDELGQRASQKIASWGLDSIGIQVNSTKPTGRVDIETRHGEPTYRFWDNVAFDNIAYDESLLSQVQPTLLYHGTLALRSQVSTQTLGRIRRAFENRCPTFIDVNLRPPHFDPSIAPLILAGAEHVKLNHDELAQLSEAKEDATEYQVGWTLRRQLGERLMSKYGVKNLWITAAEEGAAWLGQSGQFISVAAPPVTKMIDTVGAGDALTSVIIRGLIMQQPVQTILESATRFASRVCSIRGAICDDESFYRLH